jgi:ATP-dependent DNA helicase UvrD/PcrA
MTRQPDMLAPPARPTATYLDALNPAQRAAVEADDGPLLVLAGAGTGKTRVLTTRLAHLLMTGRVRPYQALAVTFTNKAAREMTLRVSRLLGRSVEGLWFGTFHALGARLLRRHAELVGLKANFTILDTDDQLRLLKQVIEAADLDPRRWPPRALLSSVERWKDRGQTPEKVPESDIDEFALGRARQLYAAYQERLLTLNACDFGDLLLHCLRLFEQHPEILADYQRRFRAILVDEYQDSNVAQYLWLRLLAQRHRNITCVGDDDQSIYSWRGAEVGNILRFEQDFPGAEVVRLECNYRSTGRILGAASGLIAHNRSRLGKTLWTDGEAGERVRIASLWDDEEEARFVGEEIEAEQRGGRRLNDIAVLVRASFQTRAFEERFIHLGLPYRVIGGPRFYERAEIRDAIAYLRVVHQPDDDLALERIINLPKRGLGEATLQLLRRSARDAGVSLSVAARALSGTDELRPHVRTTILRLLDDFERWRELAAGVPPRQLAETVLEESGYVRMWQEDRAPDAPGRLENLKELVQALAEFDNLAGFLEHVGLVMDNAQDPSDDMVSLMTLHSAKGLEFDTVFLPGWEEGVFPNQRALDEGGLKALEEERRLAYVGITRAKRGLTVSYAASRRMYNQWAASIPSRFIEELPAEHTEFLQRQHVPEPQMSGWFDDLRAGGRGPGFARMRAAGKAPLIDGQARVLTTELPKSRQVIEVGQRVFHEKFGYGQVLAVEGNKLQIAFDKAGTKKVIDSFVAPA